MKTNEPKAEITLQELQIVRPAWEAPSRCKRPPLKPAPRLSLLARLLSLLGVK